MPDEIVQNTEEKVTEGSVATETAATEAGESQGAADAQTGEKPAKEGSPTPGSEENDADTEKEPEKIAAYKAREKFKVMDSEHEVPAYLKALMKDADSEKQVIELLEKAYGLEPVKTRLGETRKERDHFKGEFGTIQKTIQDVRQTYQRGDIDAFLDKLSVPHERMLQWALEKVNYSQLSPEQKQILDERRDAQRKAWSEEQRAGSYEQKLQEQTRQAKTMLLEAGLARPDVGAFQQAYDAKVGKPGAFRDEIVAQGELAWIQSNGQVDLSPQQAIEQAMLKWRPFVQTEAAPGTQASVPAQAGEQGSKAAPQAKPSVIPNVPGRSQSPMKSGVRSVEDLKKLRDRAAAG